MHRRAVDSSPAPAGTGDPCGPAVLLRNARLLRLGGSRPGDAGQAGEPVDVRLAGGVVQTVGDVRPEHAERVIDLQGRWLAPGLWDQHVHMGQWGLMSQRVDLSAAGSTHHAVRIVAEHIASLPADGSVVQGWGHRSAAWAEAPTTAALDQIGNGHPVVLMSGDGHHAWMNTQAMRLLGLPARPGIIVEREWFEAFPRLGDLPGSRELTRDGVAQAAGDAARMGVVGIVDLEFGTPYRDWPARIAAGIGLRVRAGVYPDHLDDALAAGLRTGQVIDPVADPGGLATMGPLKIILDGSLNTRTALCTQPYADAREPAHPNGVRNYTTTELIDLLGRATRGGLQVAVHAIGDEAAHEALDAIETVHATGSIEHAQLIADSDVGRLGRLGRLGLRASVQPAHLLDDHAVMRQCWPDRAQRTFPIGSLLRAGADVVLGSDAPVAPLDPWLAMWAAVERRAGDAVWFPEQVMTREQAFAASTDAHMSVQAGSAADLVVLENDPLDPSTDLRSLPASVAATVVCGRFTHIRLEG